tara:strand:- start:277 stop:468 length:192 start_codon:yes stop_codon:yes gene_type:complete
MTTKKDITLLEEYLSTLDKRIEELEKEQEEYKKYPTIYEALQHRILELHSQWYKVKGLIIKNT